MNFRNKVLWITQRNNLYILFNKLEKGITQEQLAIKYGTTKFYISRIENNVKEVRFSTLQKIVELGLGGQLELSIKL